ncbi:MAG TPA: hypothetical protein DF383_07180 [Deltaproteobacteria bacterium]|nr:hypothetical protein [Deltaproteobacteria bacterium]
MEMGYPRQTKHQLIDFINKKVKHQDVAVLIGARQVGKTTLLQELLAARPHLYFNLEKTPSFATSIDRCAEFQDFEDWLRDRHGFDPQRDILAIDEAQVSGRLGSFIRFMKEEWENATVLLTGSQISEIHREASRVPVGRETFFELWPLSFKEFLGALEQHSLVKTLESFHPGDAISADKHQRLLACYGDYLKVGGLPEVVTYFIEKKDYAARRADIYKSYEDDFVRYFSLEEVNLFRRCMEATAANVGSPSKDTQAIRLDAPGYKKVSGIFSRLEKWRLILKVEQIGFEPEKNKFAPKRYLYDVGVLSALRLRGLETADLTAVASSALRTPLGGIIENAVALALRIGFGDKLYGLKLTSRAELDFSVKVGDIVYPMECKIAPTLKKNYLFSLREYLSRYSPRGRGFLFYGGPPLPEAVPNIFAVPYYLADEVRRWVE